MTMRLAAFAPTIGRRALLSTGVLVIATGIVPAPANTAPPSKSLARVRPRNPSMPSAITATQVLFADLQPPIIATSRTQTPTALSAAASVLAQAARLLDLPMTFALVPDASGEGSLIEPLQPYASAANTFRRTVTSPFLAPDIVAALSRHKRPILIIAGCSTEVAVLQSALDARKAGYEVIVPIDAIGSRSSRTEGPALEEMTAAGVVITSTRSLLLRITPDLSKSPGAQMVRLLSGLEE